MEKRLGLPRRHYDRIRSRREKGLHLLRVREASQEVCKKNIWLGPDPGFKQGPGPGFKQGPGPGPGCLVSFPL